VGKDWQSFWDGYRNVDARSEDVFSKHGQQRQHRNPEKRRRGAEHHERQDAAFFAHVRKAVAQLVHHPMGVRRGQVLTTYLNGQPNGTQILTGGQAVAMPFFIGGDPLNPTECFKGRISNVAVWTRALPERSNDGLNTGQAVPGQTVRPRPGTGLRLNFTREW